MKRIVQVSKILVVISLLFTLCLVQTPVTAFAKSVDSSTQTDTVNDIDQGIGNLRYDKSTVLASKGESIESYVPKEGRFTGDKYIVVERNKKSLQTTPVDISIIDSMTDRTYPGALQLANQDFVDNQPGLLTCKRKPLNITIDLPGLGKENTVLVENPTYGNISGAIDQTINKWSKEFSDTHTLPARMQYSESMVYSKSQLAASMNINGKVSGVTLGIDFDAIMKGEKKVMVAAFKQIFYTVSAEQPNNPSDLFDDSVTFDELTRKGVSNEAPPVMVSNVAYGRTIYVKLETSSNSSDVEAAFKAVMDDYSAATKAKYQDILNESTFTVVVLGGDSKEHSKLITKDFDEIRNVIKNNSEFSLKNPAYPISYTSVFLKDNAVAAIHNKTDYVETTSTEYTNGKINLSHTGGYVAQFEVTWDEFSYDEKGNEIVQHKAWDGCWDDKTAPFSTEIPLPANARNIRIYARECTGLAWEWWRTVIDRYNVPLTKEINVHIGGTTLNPNGSISHG